MEGLHLGEGLHLHLQQVVFAKFALQVLDGADTPGGGEEVVSQENRVHLLLVVFQRLGRGQ